MVNLYYNEQPYGTKIKLKGHANGLGKKGDDIVCTAISTVAAMFAQALDDNADLFESHGDSLLPGDSWLAYKVKEGKEKDADIIISTLFVGFLIIEKAYPECLKIHLQKKPRNNSNAVSDNI